MKTNNFSLKIDIDTERGTREGVKNLLTLLDELDIKATFLFSLGPDNTGRALKRIFRPGFLKKVSRSNVVGMYGIKTLLNGILWPGPHIAKRHANIMREVAQQGHETGIHCYDHVYWQDNVQKLSQETISAEFQKACECYQVVFGTPPLTAGAPGWQANEKSLKAYDDAKLKYASDARGEYPFFPRINGNIFTTLQIPTTLPTLDELLGRSEFPEHQLIDYYVSLLKPQKPNIFTMHAEIEGMAKITWFRKFLTALKSHGVNFVKMQDIANLLLAEPQNIPTCNLIQGTVEGRSGTLAVQEIQ